jgi:hypothetical protein
MKLSSAADKVGKKARCFSGRGVRLGNVRLQKQQMLEVKWLKSSGACLPACPPRLSLLLLRVRPVAVHIRQVCRDLADERVVVQTHLTRVV